MFDINIDMHEIEQPQKKRRAPMEATGARGSRGSEARQRGCCLRVKGTTRCRCAV